VVGKSLGPYKIVKQLGKGGMGEVWLAEDTRLGRQVAVKVLPAELAGDTDRRQRFEQEARAAAALNHPNIAAVHDVGVEESAGPPTHYMVQEYLQGEPLREVVARGPLPFDKALALGIEIGEALKAAHRAGIVHRDLKPDNVFVSKDGHAKVLDFGLAKLTQLEMPSGSGPSMSPTMTMAGMMLGTAGYMAPEQVRGEEIDERADLFAFGCVLYEMVTGRQAFGGDNVHESLSKILTGDPDTIDSGSGSSPQFGWLLGKLLAKDREQRYQSAGDLVVDLRKLAGSTDSDALPPGVIAPAAAPAVEPAKRSFGGLAVVAVLALALGAAATWMLRPQPAPVAAPDLRFEIIFPPDIGFSSNYNRVMTISPDGRAIAYTAEGLLLRTMDDTHPRQVPESDSARSPTFSPDSRYAAFWESGHIKRVTVEGENVATIVGPFRERPLGLHWADDDFIYVGRANRGIWRLPASGGDPEQVIELQPGEYAHGPELLPGGEWMLFTLGRAVRAWTDASIVVQSLTTNERRVLIQRGREARVTRSGHLTFVQDTTLFAVPFDLERLEVTGSPVAMETSVHTSSQDETGAAGYDISDTGVLAFAPPTGLGTREATLVFLDRAGNETPVTDGPRRVGAAVLSPDGKRIAAQLNDIEGTHIWLFAVDRAGAQRLTTTGRNTAPIWSHDGRTVYFASNRDGATDIWSRPVDLSAPATKLVEIEGSEAPTSATPDGRWLIFSALTPGNSDIGRVSLIGDPAPEILVDSPADEDDARVSADGRFISFESDETGRWDIHVMEIATGRRWIVSTFEGYVSYWPHKSDRIFYLSGSEGFYELEVSTTPEFKAGEPKMGFKLDASFNSRVYDMTPDGNLALVGATERPDADVESRPRITIQLNWFEELERRVR
jgi:serine/threonine-protein kinase